MQVGSIDLLLDPCGHMSGWFMCILGGALSTPRVGWIRRKTQVYLLSNAPKRRRERFTNSLPTAPNRHLQPPPTRDGRRLHSLHPQQCTTSIACRRTEQERTEKAALFRRTVTLNCANSKTTFSLFLCRSPYPSLLLARPDHS